MTNGWALNHGKHLLLLCKAPSENRLSEKKLKSQLISFTIISYWTSFLLPACSVGFLFWVSIILDGIENTSLDTVCSFLCDVGLQGIDSYCISTGPSKMHMRRALSTHYACNLRTIFTIKYHLHTIFGFFAKGLLLKERICSL